MTASMGLLFLLSAMADWSIAGEGGLVDAVVVQLADETCGPADGLVARIEARAGVGSVVAEGPRVVAVAFAGAAPRLGVELTLDVAGARVGSRRLGPFGSCDAALEAAALAIALVVDPLGPLPAPSSTPSVPTTPATSAAAPPPEVVIRRGASTVPPSSAALAAGVGVGSGFGVVPGPMGLVRLRLDPEVLPLAVGIGGRIDLPAPLVHDGTRMVTSVGGAFFVEGCWVGRAPGAVAVDLCGLGQAGGMRAVGVGIDNPVPATPHIIDVGAALTARVPLWAGLGAFARLAVSVPLLRARLIADGERFWESPPVAGQLSVGFDGLARGGP
jgi:hypothetical protein